MRNPIITLALLLFSLVGYGQQIFVTSHQSEADYLIYETDVESEADWIVMKTEWKNQAINGIWYFTNAKEGADLKVFYAMGKAQADKLVFYTEFNTSIVFKLDE